MAGRRRRGRGRRPRRGPRGAAAADEPPNVDRWTLDLLGVDAAWERTSGAGVTVAVVDTGVALDHPDLVDRFVRRADGEVLGIDLVDGDDDPTDTHGHGTLVAGVIAGAGADGRGTGVAPEVRLLPVRVLDGAAAGTVGDVGAAIRWAVDHGADVVNLSFETVDGPGGRAGAAPADALAYAAANGVPVVVARREHRRGGGRVPGGHARRGGRGDRSRTTRSVRDHRSNAATPCSRPATRSPARGAPPTPDGATSTARRTAWPRGRRSRPRTSAARSRSCSPTGTRGRRRRRAACHRGRPRQPGPRSGARCGPDRHRCGPRRGPRRRGARGLGVGTVRRRVPHRHHADPVTVVAAAIDPFGRRGAIPARRRACGARRPGRAGPSGPWVASRGAPTGERLRAVPGAVRLR